MTRLRVTRFTGPSKPSTLIFGGHGKCALHITRQLVALGHVVHSVIRNPDQVAELKAIGARPIILDIETASVAEMTAAISGAGAATVLWCAQAGGANPDKVAAVDIEGAIRSMDAAAQAGAKRYISISALDVRDRKKVPFPPWYNKGDRILSEMVYRSIKLQLDAKLVADRNLVTENSRRELEYTIVRPGGLADGPGADAVAAGKVHIGSVISREDVAAVVVACIGDDTTKGLVFDVVGGETSIADAVSQVGENGTDTFEGTY
ncbi:NAD(P)-binding protein [Thozetella sp. PMI_491]|nr:NAD(P)-binding protein [Thozetella sp. PMI_491]